jgi:hypothetical protein
MIFPLPKQTKPPLSFFFFKFGYDQVEIINDLPPDKTITVYRCGPLVDLCRGPHIPNTSFVKALACLKVILNHMFDHYLIYNWFALANVICLTFEFVIAGFIGLLEG